MGASALRNITALLESEHTLKSLRSREHQQLCRGIAQARADAGLTQRELAIRLKRTHSFIGKIESGERRLDVVEFVEIARALKLDASQLLSRIYK